jgi:hypothetical protein
MSTPKRISDITVCSNGIISFECTSEMYGITDAGGKAADALKNGFVSLGDGCDYVLNEEDKAEIKKQIKQSKGDTK